MGNTSVPPRGSPGAAQPPANPIMSFVPMIVVCAILYFLIIRPQQRQAKEHRKMVDNLKTGDRVLTQGGIYGTVVALKGGIVQVRVDQNTRLDFARSAITQVVNDPANGVSVVTTGEQAR